MVRWVVKMYIEVASDYKFMRCSGSNREKGVKFVKKKRKKFRKGRWWGWTVDIEERYFRLRQLESNWGMFKWGKLRNRSRQLSEGFTYEKTSTTTNDCRRIALRRDTRGAQKSVIRRSTLSKFSAGSGVFDPSFGETEQIWMMGDNKIRQGSRMEWVKNGTYIQSTYSKVSRSWVKFNVTREEKDCTDAEDVDEQPWEEMPVQSASDRHRLDRQSNTAGKFVMWKQQHDEKDERWRNESRMKRVMTERRRCMTEWSDENKAQRSSD